MALKDWSVYIVRCADGTYYTGVTKDVGARVARHNAGQGAAYTRGRGPVELLLREGRFTRGGALSREAAIKALTRAEKARLAGLGGPGPHFGKMRARPRRSVPR